MHTTTRLNELFTPEHYSLSLTLDRTGRAFNGTVSINGTSSGNEIHLHSKDLTISSATLDGKQADFNQNEDIVTITHADLIAGKHVIVIAFDGTITDAMHGLYPCYYEHDGTKKELLATQFESHHAREVFPCVDEPAAKATFDVTLTTEDNITVLGNMPVKKQSRNNDRLVTSFETTPRMSTYLLAWVAGEMHKKTATTKDGVEVNVWATPAQSSESLDFALGVATRSIEFYNDYFGVDYPLPKSDHVALPDFGSGAMENWGLITYREVALLADPATSSISSRQYIATVIAHELAHQWFGNLVTMKWWNNLWLNESFATLMEYIAVDHIHPEWNIWLDFASHESIMALRRDSIDGVQAVQVEVTHPDEISTLFDGAIVYAKGARLLRMLQQYVGDADFQLGLKQYFTDFAYSNTEGDDLWSAIEKSSDKPVVTIMNTWITQPGYPVVTATTKDGEVTLTQEQFFVGPHQPSTALWPLPLNSAQPSAPTLFDTKETSYALDHDISPQLNIGDSAHFITHYDDAMLQTMIESVQNGHLSTINRMQLLNQATLLARGGMMSSAKLIDLVSVYGNETSEPVWGMIAVALGELRKFVDDNKEAELKLRAFTAQIARQQYERLGWEARNDEPEDDTKLRATILGLTLYGEQPDVIAKAKQMYRTNQLEEIDAELRPLIISAATRHGESSVVGQLLARYISSQSAELREDICVGITSTRLSDNVALLLDSIKDPTVIRPQDAARWFVYLIRGRESRKQTWQWLRDNWEWIEKTFKGDKSYDDYPRYAASALITRQELTEYKDFFGPMKDVTALKRVIVMGISEIEGRVALIERDKPAVQQRLFEM